MPTILVESAIGFPFIQTAAPVINPLKYQLEMTSLIGGRNFKRSTVPVWVSSMDWGHWEYDCIVPDGKFY